MALFTQKNMFIVAALAVVIATIGTVGMIYGMIFTHLPKKAPVQAVKAPVAAPADIQSY